MRMCSGRACAAKVLVEGASVEKSRCMGTFTRLDMRQNELPRHFKSAGIILFSDRGFWLGLERKNGGRRWSDFHAKRMGSENAWETALRGCKEAVGVDLSHALLTI